MPVSDFGTKLCEHCHKPFHNRNRTEVARRRFCSNTCSRLYVDEAFVEKLRVNMKARRHTPEFVANQLAGMQRRVARNRAATKPCRKQCARCGEIKPSTPQYFAYNPGKKDTTGSLRRICRRCMNMGIWERKWAVLGFTRRDYEQMYAEQRGVCAICSQKCTRHGDELSVDHCHSTGVIRGLLCNRCNTAIGRMGDDAVLLKLAAEYLERAKR